MHVVPTHSPVTCRGRVAIRKLRTEKMLQNHVKLILQRFRAVLNWFSTLLQTLSLRLPAPQINFHEKQSPPFFLLEILAPGVYFRSAHQDKKMDPYGDSAGTPPRNEKNARETQGLILGLILGLIMGLILVTGC